MKLKLVAPAKKSEWGEDFWSFRTFAKLIGKKAGGILLALPTLAASTPSDVEVTITDENIEPINFDEEVDLVGISFFTSLAPRAYEIADEFRRRNIMVVLGGIHASMLPEEAIQHANSVVIGEAEDIWPGLINDFRKGTLQKFYRASCFPDLKDPPIPRWDLLKANAYCYFSIQTSRGCPYDCDFCSVKIFNGRKYRCKPIENIIREVKTLQAIDPQKPIFFVDDNLLATPSQAKAFLQALTSLKAKWWCQASINRLKDDSLLDLMYKAGCRVIFIGIESLSQKTLDLMNKSKINQVDEYREIIEKVHSHGIAIFGSFILGNDSDDETTFENTVKFINETNIAFSMINVLTPLPGTKLYERLSNKNRILSKNWAEYNGEYVCFEPNLLSSTALQNGRNWVLQQINSYKSLFFRLKELWRKGVFVRDRNGYASLFTKGRFLFTLKSFSWTDRERTWFILKSLWNSKVTSLSAISLALNFHDYIAFKGLRPKSKKSEAKCLFS